MIHARLFLLAFIFYQSAFSQTSTLNQDFFEAGYIITPEQDTVHGEIEFRPEAIDYAACKFRKNGKVEVFKPNDIYAFAVGKKEFFRGQVLDSVFVRPVIEGALSLFLTDGIHIMQKQGGDVYVVERQDKFEYGALGELYTREDTKWRGVIANLIRDCGVDANQMNEYRFSYALLKKITIEYNNCLGADYKKYRAHSPPRISFGLFLETSSSRLSGSSISISSWNYDNTSSAIRPAFGAAFSLHLPIVGHRFSIRQGLRFSSARYAFGSEIGNNAISFEFDSELNLNTLEFPFSVGYKHPGKKIDFIVRLGTSAGRFIRVNSKVDFRETLQGSVVRDDIYSSFQNPTIRSAWSMIGVEKKFHAVKIQVYTRFGFGSSSLVLDPDLNIDHIQYLSIGIGLMRAEK